MFRSRGVKKLGSRGEAGDGKSRREAVVYAELSWPTRFTENADEQPMLRLKACNAESRSLVPPSTNSV